MKDTKKMMAVFHVGRGGQFHNAGYLTFRDEMSIEKMEAMCSDYLFTGRADLDDEEFLNWYKGDREREDINEADFETRRSFGITQPIFLEDVYSIGDADEFKTAEEAAKYFKETSIDLNNQEEREKILERLFKEMDECFCGYFAAREYSALENYNENYNTRLYAESGRVVGEIGGGVLDFDGQYDTIYAKEFDDLTTEEIEAVKRSKMIISEELFEACGFKRYTIIDDNGLYIYIYYDFECLEDAVVIIEDILKDGFESAKEQGSISNETTLKEYMKDYASDYSIYDNLRQKYVFGWEKKLITE